MGRRRRFALQYTSDDDDDNAAPEAPKIIVPDSSRHKKQQRRYRDDDDDEADLELAEEEEQEMRSNEEEETQARKPARPAENSDGELGHKAEADEEGDDGNGSDAVPLGNPVEVPGEGKHYYSFEYEGNIYKLEDSAMFSPDLETDKPYVGIIKGIIEIDGSLSISAQWFYRPEEAEKEGGDPRELFYSFHIDEVPAESVMHMCVVHFIPEHKQVPSKKEHPGFIVQQVYDHREEKMYKITDKDYEDDKQHQIDLLIMKTIDRIGRLPDRDPEDIPGDNTDKLSRRGLRKRPLKPKDVPRDTSTGISEQFRKEDTPVNDNLKYFAILVRYEVITGNQYRDWWLDKFVDTILALPHSRNDNENSYAPNEVVPIVASLERSTFEALHADYHKYNQKMRTLLFNIKKSSVLCKRLMDKALDPPVLLTMTPDELKAGLTPAEIASESEESRQLQMTEARCRRCTEKKVGILDIIHASCGDRYQVECISCGYTSFASRDDILRNG
ncbi:uncharacterized protein LOC125543820 isoform X1 [Triticum urartu]|nr:uncharacterized protein LOC125527022 isoform X1 [Triticum urartu]XP_048563260.1 uncharacterized protein LOC125543820 isoform X1 [Triticum urartu]